MRKALRKQAHSTVVIANDILSLVEHGPAQAITVYHEDDPLARISEAVREKRTERLDFLVFISGASLRRTVTGLQSVEGITWTLVLLAPGAEVAGDLSEYGDLISEYRSSPISASEFSFLLRKYCRELSGGREEPAPDEDLSTLLDALSDQDALISIGRSLSLEKDPEKLLRSMLYLSKKITGADAGSIFLVEEHQGKKVLRFAYTHTFSRDLKYEEFRMPLDTRSIAGYVAVTGRVLNIPDVYQLKKEDPISFNADFDKKSGYRSRSMLVVPMKNHLDEIIGVIQLINSKERHGGPKKLSGNEAFQIQLDTEQDFDTWVVPFHTRYEALMEAVASQAAIALENRMMIKRIQDQFEVFVKASVRAIESRDPGTSGHSSRVAAISVAIANAVNADDSETFKDVFLLEHEIKELELASLLHDFGKVYINPEIFLKARKLFPKDLETMLLRFDFLKRTVEQAGTLDELEKVRCGLLDEAGRIRRSVQAKLSKIDEYRAALLGMNEPSVVNESTRSLLASIMDDPDFNSYADYDGKRIPMVSETEIKNLSISKGSLNEEERKEIQNHVVYSYSFVNSIPWPKEYSRIPEIVVKHHERLDGTGYPGSCRGRENIPLGARIIALADVFDALSSPDRPYKKATPPEKIVMILRQEAAEDKLDPDLVELFLRECFPSLRSGPIAPDAALTTAGDSRPR